MSEAKFAQWVSKHERFLRAMRDAGDSAPEQSQLADSVGEATRSLVGIAQSLDELRSEDSDSARQMLSLSAAKLSAAALALADLSDGGAPIGDEASLEIALDAARVPHSTMKPARDR